MYMPKKKQLIDEEKSLDDILSIESTMLLDTIQLKNSRWQVKMLVATLLPKSYHYYKITLDFDEAPYIERIEELEAQFDATLFRNDAGEVKKHNKVLKEMREQLEFLQNQCEHIEFSATVEEIKYKDTRTSILARVPDDVIEPFNRQKIRLHLYKVKLTPINVA